LCSKFKFVRINKVKLTVSIRPEPVIKAKDWAKRNHTSLSESIEVFFMEKIQLELPSQSIVQQMKGIAKGPLTRLSDKELRTLWHKTS